MINLKNIISTKESIVIACATIMLFFLLFVPEKEVVNLRQIDTVYFMEMLDNLSKSGQPLSMSNHSSWDIVPTLDIDAETLCKSPLLPTQPLYSNGFNNHAYYILYAFSPLAWVMPVKTLGPLLHVLPFVIFIVVVYFFLRFYGVNYAKTGLFCILIIANPNWSQAVQGQYYVDRWFLPFGLLLAIFAYQILRAEKLRWSLFVLCFIAVVTAATHERAALSAGGFLIALCVLYFKDFINRQYRILMIGLGCLLIIYALLISLTFIGVYQESNTVKYVNFFTRMISFSNLLNSEAFNLGLAKFLVVNFLFLGFLSFASPRMSFIAFIAMLPNIIGDIGGAEKTGWSTHYHTIYFPFIVFGAALGYISLCNRFSDYSLKAKAFYTLVGLAIVGQLTFDPYPGKVSFTIVQIRNHALVMAYRFITEDATVNSQRFLVMQRNKLAAAVPAGAVITTEEAYFPALYEGRTVLNYPIGIDIADYAVITLEGTNDDKPIYYPPMSVRGEPENSKSLASCMEDRLIKLGYNVSAPMIVSGSSIAILRRKSAP